MAQRQKNKKPKVEEAEQDESVSEPTEDALARSSDEPASDQDDDEEQEKAEGADEGASIDGEDKAAAGESSALARVEGEEEEEGEGDASAAQLGTERYVLAGFFATAMLLAYVVGRAIQTLWAILANKAWFSQALPRLAAVADEDKSTYGLVLGGVIAVVAIFRAYRRPDIRTWTDEVASELAKVKWPSRKEVQSSTVIVIVATTMATLYMAVLDRFWAFVTNIVYGDGS